MVIVIFVIFWGLLGSGVWGYHGYRTILAIFFALLLILHFTLRGSARSR
jgi:hypothetical protein